MIEGGCAGGPVREKYWEECSADEKIARLRDELTRLWRRNKELDDTVCKLLAHQHSATGELLQPINERNWRNQPEGYSRDIPRGLMTERERR